MLSGDIAVVQASVLDGLSLDPLSFEQDGLATSAVDVGRRQIGDFLEQDAVLERLVPPLDLARVIG